MAREEREGSIAAYSKEQGLPGAISLLKEAGCGGLVFSPIFDRRFGVGALVNGQWEEKAI